MSILPVSAKTYFNDFSFSLVDYGVERNGVALSTLQGLSNKDDGGKHIAFLSGCDLCVNDVLVEMNGRYAVKRIEFDTYLGNIELIKAYY